MKDEKEIQILATAVHSALATLHGISIIYNLRRKNYADTAIHSIVFLYDVWATFRHYKEMEKED